MKKTHDHGDHISGRQIVTGPPDDGSNPARGQETTVGGHMGTVINDYPYGVKAASHQGAHLNSAPNPAGPRAPSPDDVVIQTNIPNERPSMLQELIPASILTPDLSAPLSVDSWSTQPETLEESPPISFYHRPTGARQSSAPTNIAPSNSAE